MVYCLKPSVLKLKNLPCLLRVLTELRALKEYRYHFILKKPLLTLRTECSNEKFLSELGMDVLVGKFLY